MQKKLAEKTEETARNVDRLLEEKRKEVFQRFPLLFTLLGTAGFVATLHGFERLMDQIGLSSQPLVLLAIGLTLLIFTGTLYKKLGD